MTSTRRKTVKIVDDLAGLPLSRQRKYQIRNMREGLCIICGIAAYRDTLFCYDHNMKRGINQPGRNKPHSRRWI